MLPSQIYYCYWGKAFTHDQTPSHHLLPYHSLDVAAVGYQYLKQHHQLRRFLTAQLGITEATLLAWFSFFLALHDLGKFAESFQNLRPDLFKQLQGRNSQTSYTTRHDTLGYLAWQAWILPRMINENWFGFEDELALEYAEEAFNFWASATTGHHGQPPLASQTNGETERRRVFSDQDQAAAIAFVETIRRVLLCQPAAPPNDPEAFYEASQRLSWWLAGVTVLADWLGSNVRYFQPQDRIESLEKYWQRAAEVALTAINEAGVLPAASSRTKRFSDLFRHIQQPTPLQHAASQLPISAGPQLFILEDVTGAGKTEAALMLAHRLIAAGQAEGIFVGLPTMATANAMYDRLGQVYQQLFADEAFPSLVLAHGARDLSHRFRQSILETQDAEKNYTADDLPASARCTAWLADSRKKALLGQAGVGTIDQALLSILYSKHQSLRLLGLFGKVLVVDEVHACDAYMQRLLQTLLTFHAASGGSAILLSATLPETMRCKLISAFCQGLNTDTPILANTHYPLLTHVSKESIDEISLATRSEVERKVSVMLLSALQAVLNYIVQAAEAGRCVCWVRNTVADAREGYAALTERLPRENLDLFHARFTMGDRLTIEERVLARFGKNSFPEQRRGQVLVATQVVEQSLDLDFDEMISDLAPIDLLIQRAGRLRRHSRSKEGARITGKDQRGDPNFIVFSPEPADQVDTDWYKSVFPRAAYVYPNHAQLWLTARLLAKNNGFRMPEHARTLIEGVYSDASAIPPVALDASDIKDQGDASAKASQAMQNSLRLNEGYCHGISNWWEEALTPTRLGEPETTLCLMRWQDGKFVPWCSGEKGWNLSQVKLRGCYQIATPDDSALESAMEYILDKQPGKGRWSVLVPLVQINPGLWQGEVQDEQEKIVTLFYDEQLGLQRENDR